MPQAQAYSRFGYRKNAVLPTPEAVSYTHLLSGSVSQGKESSQSLQMMERALMTPDELKSIPKGCLLYTSSCV